MAELTVGQRKAIWAELQRDLSSAREHIGAMTKADLLAAVGAIDTWLNDNASALNNAIPLPARAQLTVAQKARLLTMIVKARWGG